MVATGFGMCAKQISAMHMWVVVEIIIIMVILSVPLDQNWSVFPCNQSGQTIATSAEVTLNGGLVREIFQ